ncbi:MAG: cytidylate kinase-like family protein, partial [Acidobacteria bacterium]|nr:cytidylate kinase-like family protein [Acidobacteriota bacterium]
GQPGCRHEEAARRTAQLLRFELLTDARLRELIAREFGNETAVPDKAFAEAVLSIAARLATEHHLVVLTEGAELLFRGFPGVLRVQVGGPESRRIGTLMLERRLDRPAARQLLRTLEAEQKAYRQRRFGRSTAPASLFDLVLNSETLDPEQLAQLIEAAVRVRGLLEQGLLSAAAEAHLQFRARLKLSKHGIVPPGTASLQAKRFSHPSEEIFANLLDFYRVAWEYEPRSFPVAWDTDGKVLESFTPDFYLPEFDLYVELTTMKQSLVTRKNRKVKLLRTMYPHLNIQVFYQKDFENLIFKYGLTERAVKE